LKIYHLNQLLLNCSVNHCLKSGKGYVWLLMKNMKWSDYGILVARIGLTNINIEEVVKHFAACMPKVIVLDL